MPSDPTSALMDAVRAYLAQTDPQFPIDRVKLVGADGSKHDLRVRASAGPAAEEADDAADLTRTELRVLKTISTMPEDDPTAEEIARAARLNNDPYLRRLLSSLRKRGYLAGAAKDVGYPLTPKGLAAVGPEAEA